MTNTQMAFCLRNLKIPKVRTPMTLGPHNVVSKPLIEMKQSYSFYWELFNSMSYATYTQQNQGDSRYLMVGSQTPNLSFGHNLCLKCPNRSCQPILDIYVPRAFQWYKERFNLMGFVLCNCSLMVWESIKTPTPKMGAHLGVWGFVPLHFPTLPRAWNVTPKFYSWLAPLQVFALVVNPRLELW
jgi:hypothetical protein